MSYNKYKLITCIIIFLAIVLMDMNPEVTASTGTKAEYSMKKDQETYKDEEGKIRGVVYFQYPKLKGKSDIVKKINDILKTDSEAFMKSEDAQRIKESTQYGIENDAFYDEDTQYYYKTLCKVTYNENSIISLHMKTCWYAGGVYNQTDYGYTYDLKSGAKLGVVDVVAGDEASIKKKILASAKKYLTSDGDLEQGVYNSFKSRELKDYKFYITKDKVYLCFESYELNRGTGWDIFSIRR